MPAVGERPVAAGVRGRLRDLAWRPVRPSGWWWDAALVACLVGLTIALSRAALLHLDVAVRDWCDAHRPVWPYRMARAGNYLGQGTPLTLLCLAVAALLAWRRRVLWPVALVVAAFVLTFGTLEPLKLLTDRAAPHADQIQGVVDPQRFGSGGVSYPSGHIANAIVWYGVLAALLALWLTPRWRLVIRLLPPVVLAVTTVYLGYHWLTDTIAGLALGLVLDRVIRRVPWEELPLRRRSRMTGDQVQTPPRITRRT